MAKVGLGGGEVRSPRLGRVSRSHCLVSHLKGILRGATEEL